MAHPEIPLQVLEQSNRTCLSDAALPDSESKMSSQSAFTADVILRFRGGPRTKHPLSTEAGNFPKVICGFVKFGHFAPLGTSEHPSKR